MFKKQFMKRVLIGLIWVICLGGLVALMSFIDVKKQEMVCRDVKVYIPGNQYFVDRDEIDKMLLTGSNTLIGRRIENINIHDLEIRLKANPFIDFARVFVDMDGVISVNIHQRQPILRIINRFDQHFYVDQNGLKIPMSSNFTARVVVANGFIDELFANRVDTMQTPMARDLYKVANFVHNNPLWDAQIEQIYVSPKREIELIPRVGNQRILLGNADSLENKFRNLLVFYQKAMPKVGWDWYKTLNIKYANQVIGIKNENYKTDSAKRMTAAKADSLVIGKKSQTTH